MNYSYLFQYQKDQERYEEAIDLICAHLGRETFNQMYYKSKITNMKIAYLAGILVDIFLDLTPDELSQILKNSSPDKDHSVKPRRSCKGERGSQD